MGYRPLFDPPPAVPAIASGPGDRRDGGVYAYTPQILLAVNVALATGRPLLVRGPSGGGKSSLARNAARVLGWRYYERVISSRAQAQDLLWEIDHLRRLQDAQLNLLRGGAGSYVQPGILWWAFDRASARHQAERSLGSDEPRPLDPNLGDDHPRAVVLLDEIDKADPDVPNNLLVPLGSLTFQVEEYGKVATTEELAPLVVITTNDERELPPAFLRRCVELVIEVPDLARLDEIGRLHLPQVPQRLRKRFAELILETLPGGAAPSPSIAEYLDTVKACHRLGVEPDTPGWADLIKVTVWKHGRTGKTAG